MRFTTFLPVLLLGCSGPGPGPVDAGSHASAALKACAAVQTPERVTTIAAAVTRLNALPAPVTPACFVAGLGRPLELVATTSVLSAQPAAGRENPRVFLLLPGLVVSVVASGGGAPLLEFAQWMTPTRTLKGELELPFSAPLAEDAPFARVHTNLNVSSCGLCHRNEAPHPTIDGGFVSDAFRPEPTTLVPLSELVAQHTACGEDPSERCELFHALFDFGAVKQGAFSPSLELFVQ